MKAKYALIMKNEYQIHAVYNLIRAGVEVFRANADRFDPESDDPELVTLRYFINEGEKVCSATKERFPEIEPLFTYGAASHD